MIQSLLILLIVIIGSIIMVRHFSGGQTLSEYANENNIPVHTEQSEE